MAKTYPTVQDCLYNGYLSFLVKVRCPTIMWVMSLRASLMMEG